MSPKKFLISALCIAVLGVAGGAWAKEAVPAKTTSQPAATQMSKLVGPAAASLDQRALDLLKKMSETLSQAKSIRFEARSMVPIRSPKGMWISLYGTSRVVKEGSDKLFAETRGDFFPYDFYFDGKTVTAYSPTKNFYAEKSAPGTVDSVIALAYQEEGKSFPYADILVDQPYNVLTEGLVRAAYVGQSTFRALSGTGSVKTDHLVFSNRGVEWQIWIGTEDSLPRMVSATYFGKPGEPSYMVEFGDWKINEPVLPETFIFKNTSKAAKVEFRNPMQQGQGFSSGAANQQ
jgi:hypothetical protein